MPNKKATSPYYYYMLEFRKQQSEKGITYSNMTEVQKAADSSWRNLTTAQKAKYVEMTRAKKGPKKVIVDEEKEREMADEAEQQIIKNFMKEKAKTNDLLTQDFFIIDVNSYCYCNFLRRFLIAEFSILRFSVQDGVKDHIHKAINIGVIPMGYGSDVKWSCKEFGLEKPDEDQPATNLKALLHYIIMYMKGKDGGLPHLYANEEKIPEVESFILQMCAADNEDPSRFSVFKLSPLFFYLNNEIRLLKYDKIARVEVAKKMLTKDNFWYIYSGLGCANHDNPDLENRKALECTSSRVHRWAFRMLERSCLVAGIEPVLGQHVPHQADLDDFQAFIRDVKAKKKEATPVKEDSVDAKSVSSQSVQKSSSTAHIEASWKMLKDRMKGLDITEDTKSVSSQSVHKSSSIAHIEASWKTLKDRMKGLDITEPMFSDNNSVASDAISLCATVGSTQVSETRPCSEASFKTLPSTYSEVAMSESASVLGDDDSTLLSELAGARSESNFNSTGGHVDYPQKFGSSFAPVRNNYGFRLPPPVTENGFRGIMRGRGRGFSRMRPAPPCTPSVDTWDD